MPRLSTLRLFLGKFYLNLSHGATSWGRICLRTIWSCSILGAASSCVAPWRLARQAEVEFVSGQSDHCQPLARLFFFEGDSFMSHAKPLGATHEGVTPSHSARLNLATSASVAGWSRRNMWRAPRVVEWPKGLFLGNLDQYMLLLKYYIKKG